MEKIARKSPDFLKNAVIYQIFLRPFTPEGTLAAATRMLPHLAELGVDLLYLTPVVQHDDDLRTEFWSDRQNQSQIGNPKNPYRIKDYFAIDSEYGSDADLKTFVDQAHRLGMKVLLDLVYYHCGPAAVFIEKHRDFVKRDETGAVINGLWHFPELNFESQELRQYLWRNMEYFIQEFGVDGYRCDVAPSVPLDFWEEGRRRMEALDPDCVMISEGDRIDDQLGAFDLNYGFDWEYKLIDLFKHNATAKDLQDVWQKAHEDFPAGARFLRILDNHDIAHDCGENRHERTFGPGGVEAALFVNFMMDGVPFIYNGQEVVDTARHSIYGNRFYGKNMMIDWSSAVTPAGKARQEFVKDLIALRRTLPALTEGSVKWLDSDSAAVVAIVRETAGQKLLAVINAADVPVKTVLSDAKAFALGKVQAQRGAAFRDSDAGLRIDLLPCGFLLLEL